MPTPRTIDVPPSGVRLDQMIRSGRFGRPVDLARMIGAKMSDLHEITSGVSELTGEEVAIYAAAAGMSVKDFCDLNLPLADERTKEQRIVETIARSYAELTNRTISDNRSRLAATIPHEFRTLDEDGQIDPVFARNDLDYYIADMASGDVEYDPNFAQVYAKVIGVDVELLASRDYEFFTGVRALLRAQHRIDSGHRAVAEAHARLEKAQAHARELRESSDVDMVAAYERITANR